MSQMVKCHVVLRNYTEFFSLTQNHQDHSIVLQDSGTDKYCKGVQS
jgi:DNA-directed RNA polymerase subunit N (RpoN/RPB10)